jgi:hypothetical protein
MRFRPGARLDPSQVEDRRGMGGGLPMGGAIPIGGGGIGIVIAVIYILLQVFSGGGGVGGPLSNLDNQTVANQPPSVALGDECQTGADANNKQDCRIVGDINSIQKYWSGYFRSHGKQYELAKTVFFTGSTDTGCGTASTDVGPFYCPEDKNVYIDLGFFKELQDRFGAQGGPFAEAYVLAHEYGHHAQDLMGNLTGGSGEQGATGRSVRTELQADCYAGVWARNAVATGYIDQITDADVAEGLDAAAAVGDDRIQQETQGRITPDTWTHGSAAQRQKWFKTGFQRGEPSGCDTFNAPQL